MNYSRAIRLARAAAGLSQKDLAELARLDASYVCLIEARRRVPRPKTLRVICKALRIPLDVLQLLAAEPARLRGIRPAEAKRIGQTLVSILQMVD